MADRLQGLTIAGLLFTAATALSADFSHALHLKLVPACATCHTAVATSAKAEDNLLPKSEVCAGCHKDVSIKAETRLTAVAKFNHSLHAKLGNIAPVLKQAMTNRKRYFSTPDADMARHLETSNACAACHRGIEENNVLIGANFPRMADCLVCHNKIDPPDSCAKCHSASLPLKPTNHSADFIDRHTAAKVDLDKSTCAVCHGRSFTCLGCH